MNLRNPRIAILFTSLFIVMVGFGIVIPVLPFYARSLGASSVDMGLLMTIFSLMQFLCAPFWGTLSDRIGRKPVLIIGMLGHGVSFILFGIADSMWLLFVSRVIGGVLSSATLPSTFAYIADVTTDRQRGSGMGMLGAAMGLGVIFGPAIGGLLAGMSLSAPFFAAAAVSLLDTAFIYFFLPESLPQARGVRPDTLRPEQRGGGHAPQRGPQIGPMVRSLAGPIGFPLILAFLSSFAVAALEGIFAFWIQDEFGYGASEMGIIFVAMGITMVVVQGGIVGRLINAIGDELVIRAGLVLTAAGFLLILLSSNLVEIIAYGILWDIGTALLRPSLATIISKRAPGGQGAAMGLQGSFDSLGRIAGPLWGGFIYQHGTSLPYLSAAAILLASATATMVNAFWRRPLPAGAGESAVSNSTSLD